MHEFATEYNYSIYVTGIHDVNYTQWLISLMIREPRFVRRYQGPNLVKLTRELNKEAAQLRHTLKTMGA